MLINTFSVSILLQSTMLIILTSIIFCIIIVTLLAKLTNGVCTSNAFLGGKIAIVTGGNSGLGYETAINFASRGCKVIIADINDSRVNCQKIIDETGNANVSYMHLDLGSLSSVRKFAKQFLESETRLDILVNNAGCGAFAGKYTDDELLKMMQINHLGHFLLVHLLVDILRSTPNSRVVFLGSIVAFISYLKNPRELNRSPDVPFPNLKGYVEYGNTKLCIQICANQFAKKFRTMDILCFTVYPGFVKTNIVPHWFSNLEHKTMVLILHKLMADIGIALFSKTSRSGAQTTLHCALSEEVKNNSGKFFVDCRPVYQPAVIRDEAYCNQIWETCEALVKLEPHEKISA